MAQAELPEPPATASHPVAFMPMYAKGTSRGAYESTPGAMAATMEGVATCVGLRNSPMPEQ